MYTLVVKGNKFQAAHAAGERGIPAAFLRETATDTILATRANVSSLAAWLAEHNPLVPGYGFPDGTLLIYSHHPDATLASLKG